MIRQNVKSHFFIVLWPNCAWLVVSPFLCVKLVGVKRRLVLLNHGHAEILLLTVHVRIVPSVLLILWVLLVALIISHVAPSLVTKIVA